MSSWWREASTGGWEALPWTARKPGEVLDLALPGLALMALERGLGGGMGLLVRPGLPVRVNGQPVLGGLRVLDHRDEILVGPRRFFFSAESTPVRVLFRLDEGQRPPTCPVCRGVLHEGDQAVCCPGCDRWYHQVEAEPGRRARPCWTYAESCRFCNHPTALTANAGWRPEKEETHG